MSESFQTYRGRGRPSKYLPMLQRIREFSGEPDWQIIDRNQATRTQPTQLRQRYPEFDFKCIRNEQGKFNMLAKYVGGSA